MSKSEIDTFDKEILEILLKSAHIAGDIEKKIQSKKMSRATLTRKINSLIEREYIETQGNGRARSYSTTEKGRAVLWFSAPPQSRPNVYFNRSLLDNYIPNVTSWLSDQQKNDLLKAQPIHGTPANTYARKISEKLMVDLSHASSALEGNTYSWAETKELLVGGVTPEGKSHEDTLMVLNHQRTIEYIIGLIDPKEQDTIPFNGNIDSRLLRDIHHLLSDGLVHGHQRGGIRKNPVEIGGSAYTPESSPQVLEECLKIICDKSNLIDNPFERSLFLMVTIPYLQPFIDVNKRTGRLSANIPLLCSGLAPLSFSTMDRKEYIDGLIHFYELGLTEKISQAFVASYTSSAHMYKVALGRNAQELKIVALYRPTLKEAMRFIGESWDQEQFVSLDSYVAEGVAPEHRTIFFEILKDDISGVSERGAKLDGYQDNIIRGLIKARDFINNQDSPHTEKKMKLK